MQRRPASQSSRATKQPSLTEISCEAQNSNRSSVSIHLWLRLSSDPPSTVPIQGVLAQGVQPTRQAFRHSGIQAPRANPESFHPTARIQRHASNTHTHTFSPLVLARSVPSSRSWTVFCCLLRCWLPVGRCKRGNIAKQQKKECDPCRCRASSLTVGAMWKCGTTHIPKVVAWNTKKQSILPMVSFIFSCPTLYSSFFERLLGKSPH